MADFLSALGSFFTFMLSQMTAFSQFFVTTTLGQIILGVIILTVVVKLVVYLINR